MTINVAAVVDQYKYNVVVWHAKLNLSPRRLRTPSQTDRQLFSSYYGFGEKNVRVSVMTQLFDTLVMPIVRRRNNFSVAPMCRNRTNRRQSTSTLFESSLENNVLHNNKYAHTEILFMCSWCRPTKK